MYKITGHSSFDKTKKNKSKNKKINKNENKGNIYLVNHRLLELVAKKRWIKEESKPSGN